VRNIIIPYLLVIPLFACETEEVFLCDVNETVETLPENFDGDEVDLGIAEELFQFEN
jgi:hypothetical protein